jgi:phosphoglycolate phosphatase-like HAD superfamily hydrolase
VSGVGPGAGAILFDMDGTLLDLPLDIDRMRREVEEVLRAAGQGGPARPVLAAIERAAAAVSDARGDAAGRALRAEALAAIDRAELDAAPRAVARPGARELADDLAALGVPLGVVTDNGRACLPLALAAAGLDHIAWHPVTRDDVARTKPAPDGVVAAARALCAGGTIWMIGDSPRDVGAARAAAGLLGPAYRVRTIAVLGGHAPEEAVRASGPDHVVSDPRAIAALLAAR